MSKHDPQSWQTPQPDSPWKHPASTESLSVQPFSNSVSTQQDDPSSPREQAQPHDTASTAFQTQYEEISRALSTLTNTGKIYSAQYRRDSLPMMPPFPYDQTAQRMQHRHSVDYSRAGPPMMQNTVAYRGPPRHQPRLSESEQNVQAKRRMAAQREKDLRNYHQEQQYNRSTVSQGNLDGALSPGAKVESERRALIARQHRALYGNEQVFNEHNLPFATSMNNVSGLTSTSNRGPSPRTLEPFGHQEDSKGGASTTEMMASSGLIAASQPPISRQSLQDSTTSSNSTKSSNQKFNPYEHAAQPSSRTSASSPGTSPSRMASFQAVAGGHTVAPIGTRPGPIGSSGYRTSSTIPSNSSQTSQSIGHHTFNGIGGGAIPYSYQQPQQFRPQDIGRNGSAISLVSASSYPFGERSTSVPLANPGRDRFPQPLQSPFPHLQHKFAQQSDADLRNSSLVNANGKSVDGKTQSLGLSGGTWGTGSGVWGVPAPSSTPQSADGGKSGSMNGSGSKKIGAAWP